VHQCGSEINNHLERCIFPSLDGSSKTSIGSILLEMTRFGKRWQGSGTFHGTSRTSELGE
jgi:hypothetical protein